MQLRGLSLSVYQSMSVSWDFYLFPFHQPNTPARSLSITGHWNVSLPSCASVWNGMFGRVESQNTTQVDAACFSEKIPEAAPYKNSAVSLFAFHLTNQPRKTNKT